MKILVTGGAGFIGSNVVDAYISAGHEVVVIDNLFTGKWENLHPDARFYLVDIRSDEIHKVFEKEKIDIVNHHAAQMSVPASVTNPDFDADVNVRGFINILEACVKNEVKKTIFISSGGAIYGETDEYPTSENCPPQPLSPYAITKAVSEQYLRFYRHHYGLEFTVLRYANVYGPRQIPHGEAGVVSIFMSRLLQKKPCTLFHFAEEPQGMTRDYCYVGDIVKANLLALQKGSNESFNIGTGIATHTAELFGAVYDAVKSKSPGLPDELRSMVRNPARDGDLSRSCLNVEKARKELDFTSGYNLEQGIGETLRWHLNQNK